MLSQWRMKDFDVGAGVAARAFEDNANSSEWVSAFAPGDTYLALHAAGRLPDPFADQNEAECAWVCEREWWWRCDFAPPVAKPGERLELTFLGLDTFATIWLNGEVLGEAANMFREYAFDVTERALAGRTNKLAIRFDPPAVRLKDLTAPIIGSAGKPLANKRNLARKAQFGWGWDWGPVLPTVGIWRPVELAVRGAATLDKLHFITDSIGADHDQAKVRVAVQATVAHGDGYVAEITLTDPAGKVAASARAPLANGAAAADFILDAPHLWWTHDLGTPNLYTLEVRLFDDDALLDRRGIKVGVRTIAIDQSADPDEPGTSFFRFVLNGRSIFSRGACWIPASSFVAALGEADYRPLLETMAEANMNMVRVWGGGVYEHDAFHDLCDALGLLVWQDFMFACAAYPQDDPAFVENVTEEVRYQIERLRNHPSMAVWCGNNENQMIHDFMRRPGPELAALLGDPQPGAESVGLPGELYYDDIMPKAVAELDPTTPYWPGSPSGGPHANSMRAGDVHDWTVWHGLLPVPNDRPVGKFSRGPEAIAYTRYAEDMARFVSEYGLHASPAMETLRRAIPGDELYLHSPAMEHRIKDTPKDKVNGLLVSVTGLPTDLDQYVDFTQITQAEGLKFAIEHFRRRMPHCSGSLIWQYNDCWPCVSWSLMDYNGFAKAGYFYTRRAYAPAMASFKDLGDGQVELWITNEGLSAVVDTVTVSLLDMISGAVASDDFTVTVEANASRTVWTMPASWPTPTASHVLHVRSAKDRFADNRLFFRPIKDLRRPQDVKLEVLVSQQGPHDLKVTLTAPTYALFVHLLVPYGWTRFSDNYFDLLPGEARTIMISNPDVVLRPEDVTVRSF
jgi:beta-mannosidase